MMSRKAGTPPSRRFKLTTAMPATRSVLAASCELSTMALGTVASWHQLEESPVAPKSLAIASCCIPRVHFEPPVEFSQLRLGQGQLHLFHSSTDFGEMEKCLDVSLAKMQHAFDQFLTR